MASKRFPKHKTENMFADFVDTHDLAPYLEGTELLDKALALAPELADRVRDRAKKRLIALRLPQWQIEGARRIARTKRVLFRVRHMFHMPASFFWAGGEF